MRTATLAAAAMVCILFGSLAFITVLEPSTLTQIWAIVLLLIGLGLAFSTSRIGSLAAIPLTLGAVLASIRAAWLLGEQEWDWGNGLLAVIIWLGLLSLGWIWFQRRSLFVRENTVVLLSQQGDRYDQIKGPTSVVSIPNFSEVVAHVPLYALKSEAKVEKINTRKRDDIKAMRIRVHYAISEPLKVYAELPNRSQLIEEMAIDQKVDVGRAVLDPGFWGAVLDRQICRVTDDIVREVIWRAEGKGPVDISDNREALAGDLKRQLHDRVIPWGLMITEVKIELVDLDPDQIKRGTRSNEKEIAEAEHKASLEAIRIEAMGKAEAEVQAMAIERWIAAIQKQVPGLSRETIEQIVRNALEEMNDKRYRTEVLTQMTPSGKQNGNKS